MTGKAVASDQENGKLDYKVTPFVKNINEQLKFYFGTAMHRKVTYTNSNMYKDSVSFDLGWPLIVQLSYKFTDQFQLSARATLVDYQVVESDRIIRGDNVGFYASYLFDYFGN